MNSLHLISHTHWDREWYLTFQQFRFKLVSLIDHLLELFANNLEFKHFMLDGQTIILDDYLQIRPDKESKLRRLVEEGRLIIGPWHVLPDEFLVSPESLLRNLLQGDRTCKHFKGKMQIGYIPDPFGHIGQMPQILKGFGIDAASVQRGLSDEPCEFWWEAPDGSRVLMLNLRDGYGNAASLATHNPSQFASQIQGLFSSLRLHSVCSNFLLMQGTDHMQPQPATNLAIEYANNLLADAKLIHSTLPKALQSIKTELTANKTNLPVITGELRSSKRHHLLPGVLSTRMWIKQMNHSCETLLEKWAEPFSTIAGLLIKAQSNSPYTTEGMIPFADAEYLRYIWRLLMENHPHDSICGCSIDQVHDEMRPRFDQVGQLGELLTIKSLEDIAKKINTLPPFSHQDGLLAAIAVFNSTQDSVTGTAKVNLQVPEGSFQILDSSRESIVYAHINTSRRQLASMRVDKAGFLSLLSGIEGGKVSGLPVTGLTLHQVELNRSGSALYIKANFSEFGDPDPHMLGEAASHIGEQLADSSLVDFFIDAGVSSCEIKFLAKEVPPMGYKTYHIVKGTPSENHTSYMSTLDTPSGKSIKNEFFEVRVSPENGLLTLKDTRNQLIFSDLNAFWDGGDCGDEYNHCPPQGDVLIQPRLTHLNYSHHALGESVKINLEMDIPSQLSPDRKTRSSEATPIRITSDVTLLRGVPRLDIHTSIENSASDHRLRVHFPTTMHVEHAYYDGHFETVRRPLLLPDFDKSWSEMPRPEVPQRNFTAIMDDRRGLLIANLGLREVEVFQNIKGCTEIAITLLRCVGWLSRDDFSTRRGHAGPELATPGAQMKGVWEFDYSLVPFSPGGLNGACHQAAVFNASLRAITTGLHSGDLSDTHSFLRIMPPEFALSAIKPAEYGNAWILRGYNRTPNPISVRLVILMPFMQVFLANLLEEPLMELSISRGNTLSLDVNPHEIITLRFV